MQMKFLAPLAGIPDAYGIMTTPKHGVTTGIMNGLPWAADNQAFTGKFEPYKFFEWLERLRPWQSNCLFVAVPDVVGNADATFAEFHRWQFDDWPVAYVAQDGSELLPFPDRFDALFVGGTTEWKLSSAAVDVIKRAQELGKHIHIGRVNGGRRYRHFRLLQGSKDFTCDGTRTRFDGAEKTLRYWRGYEAQPPLIEI